MDKREAIVRIKDHMEIHRIEESRHTKIVEALNMGITALRAEEEREKGCVFCGEERHRIREMFDDGTARILCSMNHYALSVETPADATSESIFPIYFCPMCGRKLDGGGQDARKGDSDER